MLANQKRPPQGLRGPLFVRARYASYAFFAVGGSSPLSRR
jgi:hypothetical protein